MIKTHLQRLQEGSMQVTIPSKEHHEGIFSMKIYIPDTCPKCGGKRGKPFTTVHYDGSKRLFVDGWTNPCGHTDEYRDVRIEYGEMRKEALGKKA